MVKRYALYEVPDGTADVVLASDYDAHVRELESANGHCHEAMEKLAAHIVNLEAVLRAKPPADCDYATITAWYRSIDAALTPSETKA